MLLALCLLNPSFPSPSPDAGERQDGAHNEQAASPTEYTRFLVSRFASTEVFFHGAEGRWDYASAWVHSLAA